MLTYYLKITPCDPLPMDILDTIRQAIILSPEIETYTKERFKIT